MKNYRKILLSIMLVTFMFNTNVCAEKIIEVKHDNIKSEIVEIVKKYPHTGFIDQGAQYDEQPHLKAPYYAGSVNKKNLDDALKAVKVVRYLAGVPYEHIQFTDELNNIAQHGAVLLAASDQTGHSPIQPLDMSDDFFEIAYRGCSEANVYYGNDNLSNSVIEFMFDSGQNNITRAGHRRWILKPGAENFGMGYAKGDNASYGGYRINMHVFDGVGYWECESDSYIAWPSAGDFPIQYFAGINTVEEVIRAPWSLNLGEPYNEPNKNDIVLKLTRKRDNKTWIFDKSTPNLGEEGLSDEKMHLSVDNGGYGITKAIVFRPDIDSLGTIKDGDIFTVELSGITYTNGKAAELSYDISFFDLEKAIDNRIVLKVGERKATVFGKEEYSDVSPVIMNNRTMLPARFVAENLGADVLWNENERKVTITHNSKTIELFVDSDVAWVNGERVIIDSPAFIEKSRVYTPVRFIAESLEAGVEWNADTSEVVISAKPF